MRGYTTESKQNTWSKSLSFASPESDFASAPKSVHNSTIVDNDKWSGSLSFASPESDFVSAPRSVHTSSSVSESSTDAVFEELFQSHYLYPSAETATGFVAYTEMVDEATIDTLLKNHSLKETLPKTVKDALNDERPIVITTAKSPFRVVDVNGAWEGLCGYSREEAIGCNIGSLLQGPDTNMESANAMVRSLQENGVSETVLTNYAKNGKSFENHLQIGVIPVDDGDTSSSNDVFFVGVLNNISQSSNESVAAM
jgi:PAS domain S-box-containing protein